MRRVGIFGGSFDPIHLGHLRSAEEVREALDLERVYFVPASNPPHKPDARLADGRQRLRMVELAIAGNAAFRISALEIERGGKSYSVETLRAFEALEPGAALYFILGIDSYREIHTWREAARLFEIANIVVTSRPPDAAKPSIAHLPVAAQEAFCYDPVTQSYRHQNGTVLRFLATTGFDVSATAIRSRVRQGGSVRYLVTPEVERFILENHLYRGGTTSD